MARRMRPDLFHGGIALGIVVVLVVLLLALFKVTFTWERVLISWLLAINVTAFGYYGYDKARAGAARTRVPEMVLHGLALLGGTLGCYAGMTTFRHKTIKGSFRLLFWTIVVLQVLLILALIYRLWKYS